MLKYLLRDRVARPKMDGPGMRFGGEDQAWLYREDMREVWMRTEGVMANESDVAHAHRLLHGKEKRAWGDSGYRGVDKRPEHRGRDVEWEVAMRPGQRRLLDPESEAARREKEKASVRAKAEHPFFYVKRVFGYAKVRYRGLHKNGQRIALLLGFGNLMIAERSLVA